MVEIGNSWVRDEQLVYLGEESGAMRWRLLSMLHLYLSTNELMLRYVDDVYRSPSRLMIADYGRVCGMLG